jgi:hypothetical protein
MRGWMYYQTKELALVPYMENTPVYIDATLPHLYYETKKEDKIEPVFCGDDLNLGQFVAFFEKRKTMQVLCRVKNDKTLQPRGYCWVDNPKGEDGSRSAMCGFAFWGDATADSCARDLARLGLAYWFEDLKIDVIHGIMLESNILARNFAARLGFREVAVVPKYHYYRGELVGARVMMLEAKDFLPGFEEWMARQEPATP